MFSNILPRLIPFQLLNVLGIMIVLKHLFDVKADGHAVHVFRRRHFRRLNIAVSINPNQTHAVLKQVHCEFSVTRWLIYFKVFGRLQQWKFAQW